MLKKTQLLHKIVIISVYWYENSERIPSHYDKKLICLI